jgi:hypothetical protein
MAHSIGWFLGGFVVAWTLACLMVAARRDKPIPAAAGTSSSRRRVSVPFPRPVALRDQYTSQRLKALSVKQGVRVRIWADGDFDESR